MRKTWRIILAVAAILGLIPVVLSIVYLLSDADVKLSFLKAISTDLTVGKTIILIMCMFALLIIFIFALVYALAAERFQSKKTTDNEYGYIKIGATAIENIALNSARSAKAGIKSAKASIDTLENSNLRINLDVVLYSDVEIPQQMKKIQEIIKRDVERYTGIAVEEVVINVKRVELLGTVVER